MERFAENSVSYKVTNKPKHPSEFLSNLIFEVIDKFRRPN